MSFITLAEAKSIYISNGKNIAMDSNMFSESSNKKFDIFLSHSYADKEYAHMAAAVLENEGYDVYIDWRDDKRLTRENVSKKTAKILKSRMKESRTLVYLITENYKQSLWMPWELGVFDGMCEGLNIAIFPIIIGNEDKIIEYLKLYPYIDKAPIKGKNHEILWVNKSKNVYCKMKDWLNGEEPSLHD